MQTGRLLVAGPLLVALGSLLGRASLRRLGILWSAVTAALLADVARSPVVCGANDNLSSVAVLLDIAGRLANRPVAGRSRAAAVDRQRGVVHGGHAGLRRAATATSSTRRGRA